jgi:hypothetical protein
LVRIASDAGRICQAGARLRRRHPGAHGGHADFRAGGKVFASLGFKGADSATVKLTPEQQEMLVAAEAGDLLAGQRHLGPARLHHDPSAGGGRHDDEERARHGVEERHRRIPARRQTGWSWLTSKSSNPRNVPFKRRMLPR